jgi:hypothetical protein
MNAKNALMVLLITLLSATCALADTVILKSGQKIEGKIIENTDKYVKIEFQGVALVYYQEEIASVESIPSGTGLTFNPAYTPIDFSGLAEHYPAESEENITADSGFDNPVNPDIQKAGMPLGVGPGSTAVDLSQYQEMIKSIQSNPGDISGALSKLPAEYRVMVEEAMKNTLEPPKAQAGDELQ